MLERLSALCVVRRASCIVHRASCIVHRASCIVRYRCTSFADRYGVLPFLFVRMK
ncbi:hypothetical protein DP44_5912 [Burkholderia pseudomallei]|nr:hypothetical protein DP44_5912 [Burkholderia pseudomallei]